MVSRNNVLPLEIGIMRKLSKKKIARLIKMKLAGRTNKDVANEFLISTRHVRRVYNVYCRTHTYPVLQKPGKKSIEPTESDMRIVRKMYKELPCGARILEKYIERKHQIHIPHNRIHRILMSSGYAKEEQAKKKQRKWVRYERQHSLSLLHTDWYECECGKKLISFEDDASRAVLAAGEFDEATDDNTVKVLKEAIEEGELYGPIVQILTDNGTQFCTNVGPIRTEGETEFQRVMKKHCIEHIRTRIHHPQTNGKLERFHGTYAMHRHRFKSLKAFVKWYNEVKPHMSLDFDNAETPSEAFMRKMRPEYLVGMCSRLGWW